MTNEKEEKVFPVSNWSIGPMPFYEMITFKFDYLDYPDQQLEQSHHGRRYALTPDQARELVHGIQRALDKLETLAPPADPTKTN